MLTMAMVTNNLFRVSEICITNMDSRCRETCLVASSMQTFSLSILSTALGFGILHNLMRVRYRSDNRELFYYFHGITNDGNYYVQVILPVQAPFLAPDENPNSPAAAERHPFPQRPILL